MPRLSIVTINYNNLEGLKRTIDSVISQSYDDFEFILIDGLSVDGSLEYIQQINFSKLSHVISEKDSGIYEAMNKGLRLSCGEYIQFLNSGDLLLSTNTLYEVSEVFKKNPVIDFFYSDVINLKTQKVHYYPTDLTFNYFYQNTINHQSTFFKRDLFLMYGNYNENYKIVSDWEFYLKILFLQRCTYLHIKYPLIKFDYCQGISTSKYFFNLIQEERSQVLEKYFPYFIQDYKRYNEIESSTTFKLIKKILKFRHIFKKMSVW